MAARKKKYPPVILLHGEESFLVNREMEEIESKAIGPGFEDFNKFTFYGKEADPLEVLNQVATRPMMGEPQLVLLKDAGQFKDWNKLERLVKEPVDFTILVIVHPGGKLDGRLKFVKALKELEKKGQGKIFEAKRVYDNKIPDWIVSYVQSLGLKIDHKAAVLMSEYLGTNLESISKEIDKLKIHLKDTKEVTAGLVEEYVGRTRKFTVFELQKALSSGDKKKAARIASVMAQDPKSNPIYMFTGALHNYFSRIYRVHSLKTKTDKSVAKALNLRYDFFGREYLSASKYFNRPRCEKAFEILYRYDLKSKGIDSPPRSEEAQLRGLVSEILHIMPS
ncbi:MAG: DNA polymerase III subunit delta [Saprospirales bacterium]|nr:MAG: DNA polymerase III subunit delta [Saprospirales bacterium]